jgi:hypothetical protein
MRSFFGHFMENRHVGLFHEVRISLVEADNEYVMDSGRIAGQSGRAYCHPEQG